MSQPGADSPPRPVGGRMLWGADPPPTLRGTPRALSILDEALAQPVRPPRGDSLKKRLKIQKRGDTEIWTHQKKLIVRLLMKPCGSKNPPEKGSRIYTPYNER